MLYLSLLMVFLAVLMASLLFYNSLYRRFTESKSLIIGKRLQALSHGVASPRALSLTLLEQERYSDFPLLNRLLHHFPLSKPLSRLLVQANVEWNVDRFVFYLLLFAVVGMLLSFQMGVERWRSLFVAFISGSLPYVYIRRRSLSRLKRFVVQFPEALSLMATSLRAGHSLEIAMEMVSREFSDPIGPEFTRVINEINMGLSFKEALHGLALKLQSSDLRLFVTCVLIQQEVGGNLAESLENLDQTLRERVKLQGQVRILTAQARLSGFILGLLPVVMTLLLFIWMPDYLKPLFEDVRGRYMVVLALAMQGIGFLWIRRTVSLKV